MDIDKTRPDTLLQEGEFNINTYIPYQIVYTELMMYRMGKPHLHPNITALASVSQGEIRVLLFVFMGLACSPSELVEKLGIDKTLVTRNTTSLRSKGLLEMQQDLSDKRRKVFEITPKGNTLAQEIANLSMEFDQYFNDYLTKTEKKSLLSILAKLNRACQDFKG